MNIIDKPLPRFVPTLTEVVDPSGRNFLPVQTPTDLQSMVQVITQRIQPVVEELLKVEFDRLVQVVLAEQWPEMVDQLKGEVDKCVHSMVLELWSSHEPKIQKK